MINEYVKRLFINFLLPLTVIFATSVAHAQTNVIFVTIDDMSRGSLGFRYLPVYTIVAGGIGFAIGWIVGRNA